MRTEGRREIAITGVGLVSPLGDDPAALHEALSFGRSAFRAPTLFDATALAVAAAAEIDFDPKTYLGDANVRPLDRTARLATSAAARALEASGWTRERRAGTDVGLVLGTMFGSVHTISSFDLRAQEAGPQYAKPLDFANSVINAAAGQTAIWHDLRGVNSTVAGGPTAGLSALGYAVEMLRTERAAALLAGGCDELCEASYRGFLETGRMAGRDGQPPRPVPFDAARNGFLLSEGAGLLMLETRAGARERGARVLGLILGHAEAFDPSRGRDEKSAARAVAQAVSGALADAGLEPEAVDAVAVGANGSVAGDRAEAQGLVRALGAAARSVPVMATKASLGEALGASGAISVIAALEALQRGELPGIAGLEERDGAVPLSGAQARTRALAMRNAVVQAIGFDGLASAVVVGRA